MTNVIEQRRSRNALARNTEHNAQTATTVTAGHCRPTPGWMANQDAATWTAAIPAKMPRRTRLARSATSAT